MSDHGELIALDSGSPKDSPSVAEARHIVRDKMLLAALDELFEIGMNRENKAGDRNVALKAVIEFAEGAEGTEGKLLARLRPDAARRLAKLGKDLDDAKAGIAKRELPEGVSSSTRPDTKHEMVSDGPKGKRLGDPDADER